MSKKKEGSRSGRNGELLKGKPLPASETVVHPGIKILNLFFFLKGMRKAKAFSSTIAANATSLLTSTRSTDEASAAPRQSRLDTSMFAVDKFDVDQCKQTRRTGGDDIVYAKNRPQVDPAQQHGRGRARAASAAGPDQGTGRSRAAAEHADGLRRVYPHVQADITYVLVVLVLGQPQKPQTQSSRPT